MKRSLVILLLFVTGCSHAPKPLVDPELAAYMPAGATVIAGVDLDRLRSTPLFSKIPAPWRASSYVLAAFDGTNLVTASRSDGRVTLSGPATRGNPSPLLQYATDAPLWAVARGNATLPLTGNLANLNRLLHQTEYTTVASRVGDRVELDIAGVCRSPEAAQHLEENLRAILSLMSIGGRPEFPFDIRRENRTVRATGSVTPEAIGKLF